MRLQQLKDILERSSKREELDDKDKPVVKDLVKKLRGGSKTHAKQADDLEKAMKIYVKDIFDKNFMNMKSKMAKVKSKCLFR